MPSFSRVHLNQPRREFNGIWINCLLYADDVVIIGAPETMPRLLKAAEEHSLALGYRWNPTKCVVLNCPSQHGAAPLRLYGLPIPAATSFSYLGIPFNIKGAVDLDRMLQRNISSAVGAMRGQLQPLGLRSPSFSRLTASRLYAIFVRPRFEYGLCIGIFLSKQLVLLEKAQDQCLRIAFGGHNKTSTMVFKHLTALPYITTAQMSPD